MKLLLSSLSLVILAFTGCFQPEPVSKNTQPSWIMNPNKDGKIGSVGTAYRHHKGLSYQRKLAISRALDEMALQQGVKVSLSMNKTETVRNDNIKTSMDVEANYTANSNSITAHIEDAWQDPKSQEFYIWLVLD